MLPFDRFPIRHRPKLLIVPQKRLGQNFLQDPNVIRKIVETLAAPPDAPVVEIGPGLGALTGLLADRYASFSAIEVDPRAVAHLEAHLPNVVVEEGDVLAVDWVAKAKASGGPLHVIGNLPYNITSPILFGLLDAHPHIGEAVLMMQLEVAQRLVAQPRTKAYGILSVVIQRYTEVNIAFRVSRHVFFPRPDVTSAVVRLAFRRDEKPTGEVAPAFFRQVVRTAFNQRRKTLRNSLKTLWQAADRSLPARWANARAEELTPEAFVELALYLEGR